MKKIFLTLTVSILFIPFGISQDLPSYIPTDGLVAYYPFNGNVNDVSGNDYNLVNNNVTFDSDRYGINDGTAAYFSGDASELYLEESISQLTSDPRQTFSFWFKSITPSNRYIFEYASLGSSRFRFVTSPTGGIGIRGETGCDSGGRDYEISNLHEDWHHFVISIDTQTYTVYYDGEILYNAIHSGFDCVDNVNKLNLGNDIGGGAKEYTNMLMDDIGIWNRALTEQEIQNLYTSSSGDILLNGTVSAENNQIKNVADPTDAQDAVTMAYLQTKLDELTNRVKYLEDTAPNKPSGTWTKVFDLENLPENFDFTSMQKVTQYSYNKSNKEVYFLNRNKNSLLVYDIDMNTFNEINVDYQISSGGDYIYNPQKNTIEYLRAGRETVYEIDLSSYGSSLVKSSGSDTSHYGANMFYNPFTSEIGQIFGYGWFRVKNSMANLNLENGWVVSIADSDGSPQRRTGAQVFPTKDYKKIIVLGGHGNQSGSQTEDSCSNPNTIPWASDVGVWCFQSDIWEIDLADYSATQISDFNIGMKKSSVMSYNYDKNIIINYAGILPPATYSSSYSQEVANWDFSLLFFDMNNPNLGWQEQSQSGDLPSETLEKGYFIYDENSSLFYYFRNDGVWTLSM